MIVNVTLPGGDWQRSGIPVDSISNLRPALASKFNGFGDPFLNSVRIVGKASAFYREFQPLRYFR
jgi:hypothetical protein